MLSVCQHCTRLKVLELVARRNSEELAKLTEPCSFVMRWIWGEVVGTCSLEDVWYGIERKRDADFRCENYVRGQRKPLFLKATSPFSTRLSLGPAPFSDGASLLLCVLFIKHR